MGKKAGIQWFEAIYSQHVPIVLAKSFSPELPHTSEKSTVRFDASITHLALVYERFRDRLRVTQHGNTNEVNPAWEEIGKIRGLLPGW